MFKFIAGKFGYILNFIYTHIVSNYGIAIIIFTVLLRLILLPLNIKQQKTLKKNARIQEKMKDLQDKYANDTVRLSQEVQALYKEEGVSPFSGCLNSILQLLIIISMFYLVANPLTYMKGIDVTSYKEQLEQMNVSTSNYVEISIIKNIGPTDENVNLNMNFLGLDLSDIPSQNYTDIKVFIIPILYVMTSIISMRITTSTKKKKEEKEVKENNKEKHLAKIENNDEMDAIETMNRNMRYIMPVMTVSIALIAPLGLALYWFVSNLIMILERLVINKIMERNEEKNG